MAVPIIMPKQGQSVESCIISKWHKSVGDKVTAGELLFSYETDKAAFDEEAKTDGVLLHIFYNEGDDVPVLQNVCIIGNAGENIQDLLKTDEGAVVSESAQNSGIIEAAASEPSVESSGLHQAIANTVPTDEPVGISPRAKLLAERTGVDYRGIKGSGPQGRIIESDIERLRSEGTFVSPAAQQEYFAAEPGRYTHGTGPGGMITTADMANPANMNAATGLPAFREIKHSNIRRHIAKAMYLSISTTAQLTLNLSFEASRILALRKEFKQGGYGQSHINITINDIILYGVSRVLKNHEALNAHFLDDKMLLFENVNLGLAVDAERGLMVPTINRADAKSLKEISDEVKVLVDSCRKGTINPDLLQSGTFTVTNLGTLDIESFTPVLNPPQTGILGVNNITWKMKETDGKFEFYPAMGLSLTFDHRALDGAPAARFFKDLKFYLEGLEIK